MINKYSFEEYVLNRRKVVFLYVEVSMWAAAVGRVFAHVNLRAPEGWLGVEPRGPKLPRTD
jgi:hypothetical protein